MFTDPLACARVWGKLVEKKIGMSAPPKSRDPVRPTVQEMHGSSSEEEEEELEVRPAGKKDASVAKSADSSIAPDMTFKAPADVSLPKAAPSLRTAPSSMAAASSKKRKALEADILLRKCHEFHNDLKKDRREERKKQRAAAQATIDRANELSAQVEAQLQEMRKDYAALAQNAQKARERLAAMEDEQSE